MKRLFAFFVFLMVCRSGFSQVMIQPINVADLTGFLQGSGITISNMVISCDSTAYGAMSTSGGSFPMGSGLVLSTGMVNQIPQSSTEFASNYFTLPGDADITSSVTYQSYDACAIEFDAIPSFPNIFFEYVFASEEYPEFVCSFNDAFMLLISGPGINGPYSNGATNIALLPDGSTIVSINTVHDSTGTGSSCMTAFDSLYIDNSTDTSIVFDGFTEVLTAGISLQAGQTYHFKIVVADVMDGLFDSGVFLMESSFRSMGLLSNEKVQASKSLLPVYPNPSTEGIFNISAGQAIVPSGIFIFDISGRPLSAPFVIQGNSLQVNLGDFPAGVYTVKISESHARLVKTNK
jgi:hypothetical protein